MGTETHTVGRPRGFDEATVLDRADTEAALGERLSRARKEGDLPDGMVVQTLARFVMALSEGHAVHAAAGASREELQASVDIALRAVITPTTDDRLPKAPPLV